MIFLLLMSIMEVKMEDIILLYVKIMMEIGIHMMIQIAHRLQRMKYAQRMHIFYFIEGGIGNKIFLFFLFK